MSNTQQSQPEATAETETAIEIPDTLDTADAKLVYLYLSIEDTATIDQLHTALGMPKMTLFSLLRTLIATDLVDRTDATYVCQDPHELSLNGGDK